jgi:8-oxo-dGTP pyrophosphatase MutT (NUDIX family)
MTIETSSVFSDISDEPAARETPAFSVSQSANVGAVNVGAEDIATDTSTRERMADLVSQLRPCDDVEAIHQQEALTWIRSRAGLYRLRKPDVPPTHLVAYFVVVDATTDRVLLVDHVNAGLLLATGGHCEPGEMPWQTVEREIVEEIKIAASPTPWLGQLPLFVTVTRTRDPYGTQGVHTDVSTWHIVKAEQAQVVSFDRAEFAGIQWMSPRQILDTPISRLDPHMHRFVRKYLEHRPAGWAVR